MKHLLLILVSGILCLSSCSLQKHLARAKDRIDKMYAESRDWQSLPCRTITWRQALSLMKKNNLELHDADDAIDQAKRSSLSIYTDLIPGVSYYGYMTRSISQLADSLSEDDLNTNINVTFSIPALTQVPYRVYAAHVQLFAAVKAKEGRYRELVSKLYRLVRERELARARKTLELQNPEKNELPRNIKQEEEQNQQDEHYWQEVARIIGLRDARWDILPESMPHLKWEDYEPRLDRLGELVVCQFAMRLEQARLAQYSVALNYLPTINTSIYSPSLFSSTGGTYSGTFLDEDDTRINMSISYSLDTKLTNWDMYARSKDRYEREKTKVADELIDHRNRVSRLRKSMKEYAGWRRFMDKQIRYLEQQQPQTVDDFFERSKSLYSMRMELLNQENSALESEAAIVLEYGMPDEPEVPCTPIRNLSVKDKTAPKKAAPKKAGAVDNSRTPAARSGASEKTPRPTSVSTA